MPAVACREGSTMTQQIGIIIVDHGSRVAENYEDYLYGGDS